MANLPLTSTNGLPITGVLGKPVVGVDLNYHIRVVATYNLYSYWMSSWPGSGGYYWGNWAGHIRSYYKNPYGYWGDSTGGPWPENEFFWYPGGEVSVSPMVNYSTPRVVTWVAETPFTTDTGVNDSGRVFVDGTWSLPLMILSPLKSDLYDENDNPIPPKQLTSSTANFKAQVIGRFGDVIKTAENDLLFGVASEAEYTIAWTPATNTLSIG